MAIQGLLTVSFLTDSSPSFSFVAFLRVPSGFHWVKWFIFQLIPNLQKNDHCTIVLYCLWVSSIGWWIRPNESVLKALCFPFLGFFFHSIFYVRIVCPLRLPWFWLFIQNLYVNYPIYVCMADMWMVLFWMILQDGSCWLNKRRGPHHVLDS